MLILRLALVLVSLLAGSAKCSHLPNITFTLGDLGPIIGVEKRTKSYEGAEYSNRPMYTFRAIPYAHPVIDQQRFQQSKIWNDTALTGDGSVFDATRDGPLCQQSNRWRRLSRLLRKCHRHRRRTRTLLKGDLDARRAVGSTE